MGDKIPVTLYKNRLLSGKTRVVGTVVQIPPPVHVCTVVDLSKSNSNLLELKTTTTLKIVSGSVG